jgi:hypothetical protein
MQAQLPDCRLEHLLEQMTNQPHASLPMICGSQHETKAAYRFLG